MPPTKVYPTEIVNAKIESTMLGVEDHGVTTFYLMLAWDGSSQGFGGLNLGAVGAPRAGFGFAVRRVLETVGVSAWEQLPGKLVRIEIDDAPGCANKIFRIGHIIENRWFDPVAELKTLEQDQRR